MTDKLRWGVLSTAKIGREKVIPGIQSAGNCEVVAIASRDRDRAQVTASSLDIPKVHDSYEELIADSSIDAVYIPLPNHLHAEWTMAAAGEGKHVLCEKPMAMSEAEAARVVEACHGAGVKFMEAFMYRLHPSWVKVRRLVAEGRIGELQSVQTWFSYFNDDPHNIRNVAEFGGGALMDIGCYPINVSRMMFGSEPTGLSASIRRHPDFGVDVVTSAILEFGDKTATFTCATVTEPDQRVDIYGTEGRITVEIPFNIPPDRPTRIFLTAGGNPPTAPDTETILFPPSDQYAIEAEEFAAAVLGDTPVPIPPEDGVANMAVIDRILRRPPA